MTQAIDGETAMSANRLLCPDHGNLVARPWGGDWLRRFKQLDAAGDSGSMPWGESFEIAAFDEDDEAGKFPSRVPFADGGSIDLPVLLKEHGPTLLGSAFVDRYGSRFPLLPKFLDIKQLLSVQGHPPGHTEVYIIIDAEPGATIRLGFSEDIDAAELTAELLQGIEQQRSLLQMLGPETDAAALQAVLAPWLANRASTPAELAAGGSLSAGAGALTAAASSAPVRELLVSLKRLYWRMLDAMNVIAVAPGQVIYNATPARFLAPGQAASAEVHALGNPEGREILALEIRLPGPTFRAWDNVRFPVREVDVEGAIASLNLRATRADEFLCKPGPVAGRDGTRVSVDCEFFRVEHLLPGPSRPVAVPDAGPHSLHCLAGDVGFFAADGRSLGRLSRGRSALVPAGIGPYRCEADGPAEVIRVTLPVPR